MVLLEPLSYQPVSGSPIIYLAGPITAAPPWQAEAFDLIRKLDSEAVVASPRRFHTVRHYRYRAPEALRGFTCQRAWERHYMDLAGRQGCVLFWLAAPWDSIAGVPYGAMTRFELGLWTARCSRDPSLGLCVGADPGFPTLPVLAYDLGKEMPGRKLHRSLEDTAREAVSVARGNYERWVREGSPQTALESGLAAAAHAERALADAVPARFPDNPENHPEFLRRQALRLLKVVPGLGPADLDAPEEELEELEDAEELEELETVEEKEERPKPSDDQRRDGMRRGMRETGSWFLAGRLVDGPKYLVVGRSGCYIPFLQRLTAELGAPGYLGHYMEWPDPGDPRASLAFYQDTADRIDVNLEGIGADDLRSAAADMDDTDGDKPAHLSDITLWEINRLYRKRPGVPVFWHTGGSLSPEEAFSILGARVPREFIVED